MAARKTWSDLVNTLGLESPFWNLVDPLPTQLSPALHSALPLVKFAVLDNLIIVICKKCERPILENASTRHTELCLGLKSNTTIYQHSHAIQSNLKSSSPIFRSTSPSPLTNLPSLPSPPHPPPSLSPSSHSSSFPLTSPNEPLANIESSLILTTLDSIVDSSVEDSLIKSHSDMPQPIIKKKRKKKKELDGSPEDTSKSKKIKKLFQTNVTTTPPGLPDLTPLDSLEVDLDSQCGVHDEAKGIRCSRSITCKIHSISAKRAVQGRSRLFDSLLQANQFRSQVNKPNSTDSSHRPISFLSSRPSTPSPPRSFSMYAPNHRLADSDDEVDLIFKALQFNPPIPLIHSESLACESHRSLWNSKLKLRGALFEMLKSRRIVP